MMESAQPPRVPRKAHRPRSAAARARAADKLTAELLWNMYGTIAHVEPRARIALPRWAVRKLGLKSRDALDFIAVAGVLGFCAARPRAFNRAWLLEDGSIPLPSVVLELAACGPLFFEPLGGGAFRLDGDPAPEPVAGRRPRYAALVSAAGRLLVPPAVISGLGALAGDTIVFGQREGWFHLQELTALVARTAAGVRDLAAGASWTWQDHERALAAERERGIDPLAGTWMPA